LEDTSVDGKITLKWIFKKWDGVMDLTDLAQDREETGFCKCGNESSGSIKWGEWIS
jgi:hypothetical protein